MKQKSKNSVTLGVYFDIEKIVLSQSLFSSGKLNISKTIVIPTDYKVEGIIKPLSLNNDFFSEKQKWVTSLKEVIKKSDIKASEVIVSLSHDFSIARFFTMPYVDRKFWNKTIPLESKKYLPVSFEEIVYDYYAEIIPNNKLGIFFSVTQKKTGEFLSKIFKDISIELSSIEPSVITFQRVFNILSEKENGVFIIFDDDTQVYISVFYNRIPLIFRYISFTKTSFFSDRKSLDLKGTLLFSQRILPDLNIDKIFVLGTNSDVWLNMIKTETQIEPFVIDPSKKVVSSTYDFFTITGGFTAIKKNIEEKIYIDVSQIEKDRRIYQKATRYISTLSAIIVFFFILLFLINIFQSYILSNKVSEIKNKISEASDLMNLSEEEISKKVSELNLVNDVLYKTISKRDFFAPKLSDIADVIPKDFWLTDMSYSRPFSVNKDEKSMVTVTLNGETLLSGDLRASYFDYFKKEIRKLKSYKICNPPGAMNQEEITDKSKYDFSNLSGLNKGGATFTISCTMESSAL